MLAPLKWPALIAKKAYDWYARNGYYGISRILSGFGPSWSGESVTDEIAMQNSVVWCCRRIISESVGFMPLDLMLEKDGEKSKAKKKPLWSALHNAPNDEMSAMTFRETLTNHLVGGMAYAQIMRRSGTNEAMELYPLLPSQVRPDRDDSDRLIYLVKDGNAAEKTITVERGKPHKLLVIPGLGEDGIRGYSVITMARQSIGAAIATDKYAGRYFARGGRQPGYIKTTGTLKREDAEKFAEDLNKALDGSENFHKWPIFPSNAEFAPFAWSPEDSQFLESRQFSIPEICRWFLISPHMVGDLSRATFSNIEHLALQFVKMTLTAWITRWEQNLWRCVLTSEEKEQGYYFKHNVNGLLRGDFASRMAGYSTLLQNGIANIDEIRDLEDWNPLPGGIGKKHRVQLNMQIVGEPVPQLTSGQKQEAFEASIAGLSDKLERLLNRPQ